jgi:hypothetical protein
MPISKDYTKSWIATRGSQTFNAPGTVTVPYGRYRAVVNGVGAPGNNPQATAWTTNYNVAYPIANQPVANRPATSWTTNYNVSYPADYPLSQIHDGGQNPPTGWASGFHTGYSYWVRPQTGQVQINNDGPYNFYSSDAGACDWGPSHYSGPSYLGSQVAAHQEYNINQCVIYPGYPYQVAYYNTVYNVAYPVANQPITAYTTNYSTNYNTVRPIANQPATTYVLGNPGGASSALGVTAPGGPTSQAGTPIAATLVSYNAYPDNANYPVTVPSGGQINITFS